MANPTMVKLLTKSKMNFNKINVNEIIMVKTTMAKLTINFKLIIGVLIMVKFIIIIK